MRGNGRYVQQQGLTLIELLIVLTIAGILATLGFVHLPQDRLQLREASRVLQADLTLARSEAIRQNTFVAVRFDLVTGTYQIFADADRNQAPDDGAYQPLASSRTAYPRVRLSTVNLTGGNTIWFDMRGLPRNAVGGFSAGTITFSSTRDTHLHYRVIIASHGRVRIEAPR